MRKYALILPVLLLMPMFLHAKWRPAFSIGVRSTASLFEANQSNGLGTGGGFRIKPFDRVNTEWYADWIGTEIPNKGYRNTAHIGWAVMYYFIDPEKTKVVQPYLMAGHCFDYAEVRSFQTGQRLDRWSSAVHGGLGCHFKLTEYLDMSLTSQYMMHLGKDLHFSDLESTHSHDELPADHSHGNTIVAKAGLEGHWLNTVSLYITLFK